MCAGYVPRSRWATGNRCLLAPAPVWAADVFGRKGLPYLRCTAGPREGPEHAKVNTAEKKDIEISRRFRQNRSFVRPGAVRDRPRHGREARWEGARLRTGEQ